MEAWEVMSMMRKVMSLAAVLLLTGTMACSNAQKRNTAIGGGVGAAAGALIGAQSGNPVAGAVVGGAAGAAIGYGVTKD